MTDEISVNLVDMDVLVYTCAFACAKETEAWKVLWTAKKMLAEFCALSGCTHYLGYLTHSETNFRLTRATTWPYKGNRPPGEEKPKWFQVVRKYYEGLSYEVSGIEADDALTIAAEYYKKLGIPVACSTKDKDLKQYPWSVFVDMNTKKVYSISKAEAHRNLWLQMLIGDVKTDNIPGISQAAKCETTVEHNKLVRGAQDLLLGKTGANALLDLWDPEDYCVKVYEKYLEAYQYNIGNTQEVIDKCYEENWVFGEYRFYETWDLIHMLLECPDNVDIHYNHKPVPVPSTPKVTNEFHDLTGEDM